MATRIVQANCATRSEVRGRPRVIRKGHHPSRHAFTAEDVLKGAARRHASCVDATRLDPLLEFLVMRYGSRRRVARALGISQSTFQGWFEGRSALPDNARRVVEFVLAHRRRGLASMWDVEPRAAVAEERRNDDREREYKRTERARRRVSA